MKIFVPLFIAAFVHLPWGLAAPTKKEKNSMFKISSPAFHEGETIPKKYTGEGQNVSPPLKWSNLPNSTQELVLICDDPDAPGTEPWVHWAIYNISPETNGLLENIPQQATLANPVHASQGINSFGSVGYGGPMPPIGHGPHRYFFKLYALNKKLKLAAKLTKEQVLSAIRNHIIAQTEIMGRYQRDLPKESAA